MAREREMRDTLARGEKKEREKIKRLYRSENESKREKERGNDKNRTKREVAREGDCI